MEKSPVSELLDSFKERLSSPLFGTFFISFLFFNWKIPVGLFQPLSQLKELDCKSYFDLVEKNANLWKPIAFTLIYLGAYPWIKHYLKAWSILSENSSDNWWLKKTKKSSIPYDKYFVLREDYKANQKRLDEMISDEKNVIEEKNRYWSEKSSIQEEYNSLRKELDGFRKMAGYDFFNGSWVIHGFVGFYTNYSTANTFNFKNSEIVLIENDGSKRPIALHAHSGFNTNGSQLILIVQSTESRENYTYILKYDRSSDEMEGILFSHSNKDETYKVNFKRL